QGDYDDARDYHQQSLELKEELGDYRGELRTIRNQIRTERATDNISAARKHCEAAFDRLDDIDRNLPDERARIESLCEDLDDE
ncbi:MAG: hypothetical protein ABEJ43_04880, partial [Haloferacaceae archaeon]